MNETYYHKTFQQYYIFVGEVINSRWPYETSYYFKPANYEDVAYPFSPDGAKIFVSAKQKQFEDCLDKILND